MHAHIYIYLAAIVKGVAYEEAPRLAKCPKWQPKEFYAAFRPYR